MKYIDTLFGKHITVNIVITAFMLLRTNLGTISTSDNAHGHHQLGSITPTRELRSFLGP